MTQYDFTISVEPDVGSTIVLVDLESKKEKLFFLRGVFNVHSLTNHMHSLTDSLCEQWFEESLSAEERKAKQKLRKEAQRAERALLDAEAEVKKAEATRIRAEQKAEEKARRKK